MRVKASHSLHEFDLIRAIHRRYGRSDRSLVRGIGDDAAVVVQSPQRWSLLTTDLLAESVHFDLNTATFMDVGFRAAAANLSDIAAMGGAPRYLLVALAIPRRGTDRQVHELYRGMMAACRPHGVRLIGGDLSASSSGWFIAITLLGSVPPHRALFRRGARAGDRLYVTGTLGDSLAGLKLLRQEKSSRKRRTARHSLSPGHRRFLIGRHLRPSARVGIGQWLSNKRLATSAIDLSDGLSGDVRHICDESRVGAEIDLMALPVSAACRTFADRTGADPSTLAVTGGEDFELLFTTPPRLHVELERQAAQRGFRVTCIGTIRPARDGIKARLKTGALQPLAAASYEHFQG
ncbi:MAG TPA: thiamine-phosphate kinase [Nitrospira sp.]|nr:thiamine-phosphate kinase [Nitrospira sp.]